jgi:hypothetical protein
MIKLKDLLDEVYVQVPGDQGDEELMQKGFKLGKATTDPETGAVSTDVEYLPEFETVRRQILRMRKEFQPFKYAADENVAKVAKEINSNMTKLSQLIFALDKMVELQRKNK